MTLISLLLSLNLLSVTPQAVLDGRAELYSRQYSEALSFFEAALKENPKNLEAVLGKIDALCYTKKNKEAFSFADAVYAPGTPEYKMIQIYKDLWDRKNKDAKTKLLALISEKPQFHIAHYHLGCIFAKRIWIRPLHR
ncbi:MAG: hypothetical protein CR997_12625 [Acidobacteria bacterium]|nr:MAG: hypothetical protein CR997_12625 [Acidobacteriota bacterium]